MKRRYLFVVVLLATSQCLTGCKKEKKSKKAGKEAEAMAASMGAMDPDKPGSTKGITVDDAFAKAVRTAAGSCKVESLSGCAEFKPLENIRDRKGAELQMFLSALSLMGDDDLNQANVAARSLSLDGGTSKAFEELEKEPAKLEKKVIQAALANLSKLHQYNAAHAAAPFGALAGLYGLTKEYLAEAGKHKDNGKYLMTEGAKYFLRFGRLKAFEAVQQVAKQSGGASEAQSFAVAALSAPRNMYKWTEDEYKQICPWAEKFLDDASIHTAAQAGHLMIHCKKHDLKYIDSLLAAGRKRIKQNPESWKNPVDFPYRDVCFGGFFGGLEKGLKKVQTKLKGKKRRRGRKGKKAKGPHEVCQKTYKFLQEIVKNKKVAMNMRVRALEWITYQERTKHALKIMKKYRNYKEKEIKMAARKQMKWLKDRYLKRK